MPRPSRPETDTSDAKSSTAGTRDGQNVAVVYERLRDAILRGEVPAGTTTTQVTLGKDFQVGRTPLREALRMLQLEGLVIPEPNRRVHIAGLSGDDAEDLYVMRIALEVVAVRLTVPTVTRSDIAQLEGLMAQMDFYERNGDRPGLRQPHREFHLRLVEAAGPRGVITVGQLFDHAERYRLAHGAWTPELWSQRTAEHRQILDALADHDVDRVAEKLASHYARTALNVFESLDPGHDLGRLRATLALVAPGSERSLD